MARGFEGFQALGLDHSKSMSKSYFWAILDIGASFCPLMLKPVNLGIIIIET